MRWARISQNTASEAKNYETLGNLFLRVWLGRMKCFSDEFWVDVGSYEWISQLYCAQNLKASRDIINMLGFYSHPPVRHRRPCCVWTVGTIYESQLSPRSTFLLSWPTKTLPAAAGSRQDWHVGWHAQQTGRHQQMAELRFPLSKPIHQNTERRALAHCIPKTRKMFSLNKSRRHFQDHQFTIKLPVEKSRLP